MIGAKEDVMNLKNYDEEKKAVGFKIIEEQLVLLEFDNVSYEIVDLKS